MKKINFDNFNKNLIKELTESLFYLSFFDISINTKTLNFENFNEKDIFLIPNINFIENQDINSIASIIKNTTKFFKSLEKSAENNQKELKKDLKLYFLPKIEEKLSNFSNLNEKYEYIHKIFHDKELKFKILQMTKYFHIEVFDINSFKELSIKISNECKDTKKAKLIELLTNYFTILELIIRSNSMIYLQIESLLKINYFKDIEQLHSEIKKEYDKYKNIAGNLSSSSIDEKTEKNF